MGDWLFYLDITEGILWNGEESSILDLGFLSPLSEEFKRFDIELSHKEYPDQVFDKLVLLVLPKETENLFNTWYASEISDKSWLEQLPPLYSKLSTGNTDPEPVDHFETIFIGTQSVTIPIYLCNPDLWEKSKGFNGLLHPGAAYEMRSKPTPTGGHGHQAMYTSDGNLISTNSVSAGTADRSHKSNLFGSDSHYNRDVKTFIWAMHLDANPVDCDFKCLTVSGDFVRQGEYLNKYLAVRPPVANSKPMLTPLTCSQ